MTNSRGGLDEDQAVGGEGAGGLKALPARKLDDLGGSGGYRTVATRENTIESTIKMPITVMTICRVSILLFLGDITLLLSLPRLISGIF
jgi:hypothetical protein